MKEYKCEDCEKKFTQKCHLIQHVQHKKFPCVKKRVIQEGEGGGGGVIQEGGGVIQEIIQEVIPELKIEINEKDLIEKKISCRSCLKSFSRLDNLKRHILNDKCEVLRLQNQQKENIFVNLLSEEKIISQTKKELNEISENKIEKKEENINQIDFLIMQIGLLNEKLEEQKRESEKQKIETEQRLDKQKMETEQRLKTMTLFHSELEKNNKELKKTNDKLQNKVSKIVNKNQIINTVINNNCIKLVDFGNEDLDKLSYNIFIDTIKSQGVGLYNKAIEGIHFNKDHPENQNIYISDFNRDKVMIYKNEKWFLDNWDNIFPKLLEKVIQFGYDKNEFLLDCDYKSDGKKFNKQMIKNGIRWYKLLDESEPDTDYFILDEDDRPQIDESIYNDYLEMQEFRKAHPKKQTESNIKNKMKLNIYNKREIPIDNYKKITNIDMEKMKMIE